MDEQIGRLLKVIDDPGQREDTLLNFSATQRLAQRQRLARTGQRAGQWASTKTKGGRVGCGSVSSLSVMSMDLAQSERTTHPPPIFFADSAS